ncbi:carbohydrate porin [Sphingomonas oleivorans]|uniref:Carbohydrate porin n=2 Tax=Sphingomonas oleivorans TaxID=1735121 RepID=A0A2T5FYR7_9SPHN|nr:carbohydrate porin [Sphingomonas oleivorans]
MSPAAAQQQPETGVAGAAETLGIQPEAAPEPWQPLADKGIKLRLDYTGQAATNVSGGIRKDAAFAGQLLWGADFDMEKIAGIDGGALHFAMTQRHGKSLSRIAIGNNTSVQEIYGTQNTHLALLTWEQKLLDDKLMIEAGRTSANIAFLTSPIYCNFQSNSACGNPTFVFKTSNFTFWPASSWGARAKGWFNDRVFAHVGVYEVNPDRKRRGDHGFNFGIKNATGVIVPYEIGYSTTFANDRLPRNYIIGGWFDRGDYSDPLRDEAGGLAVLTNRPYATRHGRSGVYFRFDQMITRPDPRSERGLTLFGVAMFGTSGRLVEKSFFELGLLQTGTFPGRDKDTLGFVINDQRFSDLALENIRAARVSAGGSPDLPRHQIMMELAYGAQLSPAIRISPNLQYIINPDQTSVPFRTRDIKDAFVLGFKFTIDAPTLLAGRR